MKALLQRACQPLEALIYGDLSVIYRRWVLGTEQDCGRGAARSAGELLLGQQARPEAKQHGAW
ncbi:hypothetical protein PSN_2451 [Pseudomonas sp. NGC7]